MTERHNVELATSFVDRLIRDALDTRREQHPSVPDPVVDWEALWQAGTGSATIEERVGRFVVQADALANDISQGRATPTWQAPSPTAHPPVNGYRSGEAHTRELPIPTVGPMAPASTGAEATVVAWPHDVSPPFAGVVTNGRAHASLDVLHVPPVTFLGTTEEIVSGSTTSTASASWHRRQRLATVFGWIRNAGLALLLFAAWQLWGTSLVQHRSQQALKQQFATHVHQAPTKTEGPTLISADTRLPEPPEGSVVARIQIPAIGVDQYVVEGTAEGDLQKGPGHYIGTAMPGQAGNVAIAGHRTTYGAPFYSLNNVASGDEIDLTTDSGMTLDYVVTQAPVAVAPTDVQVLNSFGDNRLTLTTCNPRYSSSQRLVVVAILKSPVAPDVAPSATRTVQAASRPPRLVDGGSVGWNLSYLPAVLAVLVLIALLGLANRRAALYFGSRGRWLILAPIWLASIYLLFGLLSSFVPSTL